MGDDRSSFRPDLGAPNSQESADRTRGLAEGVRYLGPAPWELVTNFVLFYYVGLAFQEGAKSQREAVEIVESWALEPSWPVGLRSGRGMIYNACKGVATHFERAYGAGQLSLFERPWAQGAPIRDLSHTGWEIWKLIGDWLVSHGVVPHETIDISKRVRFPAGIDAEELRQGANDSTGKQAG